MTAPSATAVLAWLLVKLAYAAVGGHVAARLVPVLLARRDGDSVFDAVTLFVVVHGLVLLWPIPLLMSLEQHRD